VEIGNLELLRDIDVKNWNSCKWTVKKLELVENNLFTKRTEMQVKYLSLINNKVDFFFLPLSLETLKMILSEDQCNSSQQLVLPNLKILHIYFEYDYSSLFTQNINCPNLTELYLENPTRKAIKIDVSWIPKSVKILQLVGISIINERDEELSFDTLIVEMDSINSSYEMMNAILGSRLQAKEIMFTLSFNTRKVDFNLDLFIEYQKKFSRVGQRIYAGPFFSHRGILPPRIGQFGDSPLSEYVDQESEYYVFENQMGKAISADQFEDKQESITCASHLL